MFRPNTARQSVRVRMLSAAIPRRWLDFQESHMPGPNLVLIMTDTQGANVVGCYGRAEMRSSVVVSKNFNSFSSTVKS